MPSSLIADVRSSNVAPRAPRAEPRKAFRRRKSRYPRARRDRRSPLRSSSSPRVSLVKAQLLNIFTIAVFRAFTSTIPENFGTSGGVYSPLPPPSARGVNSFAFRRGSVSIPLMRNRYKLYMRAFIREREVVKCDGTGRKIPPTTRIFSCKLTSSDIPNRPPRNNSGVAAERNYFFYIARIVGIVDIGA